MVNPVTLVEIGFPAACLIACSEPSGLNDADPANGVVVSNLLEAGFWMFLDADFHSTALVVADQIKGALVYHPTPSGFHL